MWYRNNKAAEKYSAEEVEEIYEKTYQYIQNNPEIFLKIDVDIYMLTTHSACQTTRSDWINRIHSKNRCIVSLHENINNLIESRLVQKEKGIRPNIQAMVLQNKHDYRERHENKISGGAAIIINRPADKPKLRKK